MKLQKVNWVLLAVYFLVPPLLLTPLCFLIPTNYGIGDSIALVVLFSVIGWPIAYIFGSSIINSKGVKKAAPYLDSQGFVRNYTFNGRFAVVYIDLQNGRIAIHYKWNPFKTFILDASHLEKAYTDDGCTGKGAFQGSWRVRFVFIIDGMTFKVTTFDSNSRFSMNNPKILEGISKADLYVDVLNTAKAKALARAEVS